MDSKPVVAALALLALTACSDNPTYLSYRTPSTLGDDFHRDIIVDACRLTGQFAAVGIVELTGDPTFHDTDCPDPTLLGHTRHEVKLITDIDRAPTRFTLASSLFDVSLPREASKGDRFLVSIRPYGAVYLLGYFLEVDYEDSSEVALQNTTDIIDLPPDIEALRTAVAGARSQANCGSQFPALVETEEQLREDFADPRFCESPNATPAGSEPEPGIPESDL